MGWMECPLCGAQFRDELTVCEACGGRLQTEDDLAARPRRKLGLLGWLVIAVALCLAGAAVTWGSFFPGPVFVLWAMLVVVIVLATAVARTGRRPAQASWVDSRRLLRSTTPAGVPAGSLVGTARRRWVV